MLTSNTEVPAPGKRFVSILIALNHPISRGTIVSQLRPLSSMSPVFKDPFLKHAKSNDPIDNPEINPNYFKENFGMFLL